ncbi:MAG: SufD family Fe-S cluster assembly protein [Candidatus Gracilibacteria bacterium]
MKITKNGFYTLKGHRGKLSELKTKKLIIGDNLVVIIFDDINKNIDIDIGENSRVEFYGVGENENEYKINFIQNKKSSTLLVKYLLLSKNNNKLKVKIASELSASFVKSNIKIISIVGNNGLVDIDGIIQINKGIKKVDGNLIEENLFLGNSGKVKGIPTLLVRSSDVKASHSCKIERINDDQLFYLRSRGIGRENALSMVIEARIKSLFLCLSMVDNDFYEKLINNIIKKGI